MTLSMFEKFRAENNLYNHKIRNKPTLIHEIVKFSFIKLFIHLNFERCQFFLIENINHLEADFSVEYS